MLLTVSYISAKAFDTLFSWYVSLVRWSQIDGKVEVQSKPKGAEGYKCDYLRKANSDTRL